MNIKPINHFFRGVSGQQKRLQMIILQVLLALFTMTSCNNNSQQTTDDTAAFEAFCEHFSKSSAFAHTEMNGRKILLVSQETFGENEKSDLKAIEASLFALDKEGRIVALGSIRSQGTLYPVSILDGKLMVAGHQFVKIYTIRGDIPELVLDLYDEGESSQLSEMFQTFEKGTPIKFERK